MDTINTIITNAHTLSQANINWSLSAGPIWLAFMTVCFVVGTVAFGVSEARRERQEARQALYRKAHAKANIRLNRMERQGYQEVI
jgi:hypothetical protein